MFDTTVRHEFARRAHPQLTRSLYEIGQIDKEGGL
jgi:hypothetical protein